MKVPNVLKNKYVLYVLLFLAIVNVLGYVALEEYNALALFTVLGLLTSYFSKNMTVNLLVPIVGTSLMVVNNKVQEGFDESLNYKKKAVVGKVTDREAGEDASPDQKKKINKVSLKAKKMLKKASNLLDSKKKGAAGPVKKGGLPDVGVQLKPEAGGNPGPGGGGDPEEEEPVFEGCSKGTSCPKGKVCNSQADCVKSEKFRNNVPPSSPAAVDEDEDESVGDRIDYAATMEQAYDNLQKMLGEGGMKGITSETKKLVSQQKDLMNTLNSMAPVLTQAKETLAGMDLPSMGEIGNLMKKIKSKA